MAEHYPQNDPTSSSALEIGNSRFGLSASPYQRPISNTTIASSSILGESNNQRNSSPYMPQQNSSISQLETSVNRGTDAGAITSLNNQGNQYLGDSSISGRKIR